MKTRNEDEDQALIEHSTKLLRKSLTMIEKKINEGTFGSEDVSMITNITKTLSQLKVRNQIDEDEELDDEERDFQIKELVRQYCHKNGLKLIKKNGDRHEP